jgi:hypothetical protein
MSVQSCDFVADADAIFISGAEIHPGNARPGVEDCILARFPGMSVQETGRMLTIERVHE